MVLQEEVKTSKISEFPILSIRNGKLENPGNVPLLQILAVVVTEDGKGQGKLTETKLKDQDMLLEEKVKTSELPDFSILSYTQS